MFSFIDKCYLLRFFSIIGITKVLDLEHTGLADYFADLLRWAFLFSLQGSVASHTVY